MGIRQSNAHAASHTNGEMLGVSDGVALALGVDDAPGAPVTLAVPVMLEEKEGAVVLDLD